MPEIIIPPAEIPVEDPAAVYARQIIQTMTQGAEALLAAHQRAYHMLWKSADATPARILEEMGKRAAEAFVRGGDTVGFLLGQHTGRPIAQMQASDYQPPVPYTIHEDGTVTLDS